MFTTKQIFEGAEMAYESVEWYGREVARIFKGPTAWSTSHINECVWRPGCGNSVFGIETREEAGEIAKSCPYCGDSPCEAYEEPTGSFSVRAPSDDLPF